MSVLFFAFFWLVVLGGGFYLAVRLVRAFENKAPQVQDDLGIGKRVQLLEEMTERQSAEIEQLTENQRFLESLLKSKPTLPDSTS